ncbi:MAG: winged helix-turn-helix domain-containing protein, partial [Spirochaetota bacterium]
LLDLNNDIDLKNMEDELFAKIDEILNKKEEKEVHIISDIRLLQFYKESIKIIDCIDKIILNFINNKKISDIFELLQSKGEYNILYNNYSNILLIRKLTNKIRENFNYYKYENKSEKKSKDKINFNRTNEKVFEMPILKVLIEMGGKAEAGVVLDKVYEIVKPILNEVDYEVLDNSRNEVRWRNTAKWCRKNLIIKGFMSNNTKRGIWEITEEGKKYFIEHVGEYNKQK